MTFDPQAPTLTNLNDAHAKLMIDLISHGVKNGTDLPKADLYIDCRGIANPFHAKGLGGTGDDPSVQDWVRAHTNILTYHGLVREAISRLTMRRGAGNEFTKPFTICTMCAHGIHRSRAMKHILAAHLSLNGYTMVGVK